MNNCSYILIGDDRGRNFTNEDGKDKLLLSGLYLWSTAFRKFGKQGTIDTVWRLEDLEDYDVVHINYTPSNIQLPTVIRNELGDSSDTKLVINVDLDISKMSANWSYHITEMMKELKMADCIFHVEPKGAEILTHMLDTEVKVCPHPVDVSGLYDHIAKERDPMIGVMFHRYTAETLIPYIATKNIPMRRVLFGYTPIGKQGAVANAGMYDDILMYQNYGSHIDALSRMFLGCDLYSGYSFGRSVVEFAGLLIPAVVSNTIDAANRLFPDTCVNPFDTKGAEELYKKLLDDPDFADHVIKQAHEGCKFYSLENSYRRFMEMIEA